MFQCVRLSISSSVIMFHRERKECVSVSAMTYSASQKRLLLLHKSIKKRIMVIENPNPIPLEYPTLLEVLKKELAQDPKKSLVSFCEKHSINYDHFNRWLRTTGRSFTRLCNEVRLKTGLPQNSNELYLTYIIHSGFISGYQNRYGDNLKPPTNVYHRMTA